MTTVDQQKIRSCLHHCTLGVRRGCSLGNEQKILAAGNGLDQADAKDRIGVDNGDADSAGMAVRRSEARLSQGRLTDVERYVAAAQGAARRASALTHRLLAFSRRQTLDPKPTDVNRLVKQFGEMQKLMKQLSGAGGRRMPTGMLGRR